MKRLFLSLASATSLSLVVCPPALADDVDDSYTPITECGTVIYEPGHYRLVNDLIGCDVPDLFGRPIEYGVGIASDDVVLDFDGHVISCLRGGAQDFLTFGIFTEPLKARIQIRDGAVTSCNLGIEINQNDGSSINNMTLAGNGVGIELLAGSDVEVKRNSIIGSSGDGIVAIPFFFGEYLGPGSGHRIHKNLIVESVFGGFFAIGIEDSIISCNRADRNQDGIFLLTVGPGIPLRNMVHSNVTNDNVASGIAAIGRAFDGFVFDPIPADNVFKRNTALNNPQADFFEVVFDFADGQFKPDPNGLCPNTWKQNTYGAAISAEGCIGPPKSFGDDDGSNGCAPELDDDDEDENVLKDPSFELQLPTDQGGWSVFDPNQSWFTADRARSGQQSLLNTAFFGVAGSFQEFSAEPGSIWRLTGYGLTATPLFGGPAAFGIVQFSFFDEFGNDLGTVETAGQQFPALISNRVDQATPADRWIFLDTGIGTAPEGTATIQAFTLYIDFSGNFGQGVYFDDLKLCALEGDGNGLECMVFDDGD